MNKYGAMAQEHWRRWLPTRYATIQDPDSYFSELGIEVSDRIAALEIDLLGPDDPNEEFFTRVGRRAVGGEAPRSGHRGPPDRGRRYPTRDLARAGAGRGPRSLRGRRVRRRRPGRGARHRRRQRVGPRMTAPAARLTPSRRRVARVVHRSHESRPRPPPTSKTQNESKPSTCLWRTL